MDENKNKGVDSTPSHVNDALLAAAEQLSKKTEGLYILSSKVARTSKPVADDATVAEQISYAEEKLKRHYALKQSVKADGFSTNQSRKLIDIDVIKAILAESALGAGLLKGTGANRVELVLDDQMFGVQLHKGVRRVAIHPQMTYGEAIFLIARELRRAWLSLEGTILYPLAYQPDDAILMNRILEADCRTVAIWTAWELKLQGFDDAWEFVLCSNEAYMASAFARTARDDFRSLDSGKAARSAFDAWFVSGMVKKIDHRIIQDMLADEKGYVFSSDEPPLVITASLVDAIGEVPGDRNYIRSTGEKPLPETDYAAVKDRSNANFLWFVKFEKSFQATEAALTEQERNEKQRLENIENSRKAALDIKEIAKTDEKIIDLNSRFERHLEKAVKKSSHMKKAKNTKKASGRDQKTAPAHTASAEIVYLFGKAE